MYNEKILSQLKELNFLHVIKKSNVSIISKKNTFGDTVKFYAQINKNDVVQKISFKATGCTHFIVFCNHFCELVQGKTIDDALKISGDDLENFVMLEENRKHIIKIILDTFMLLIKKYRRGVEKGRIEPIEIEEVSIENKKITKKSTEVKISAITKEHKDIKYIKEVKEQSKIKKGKKKETSESVSADTTAISYNNSSNNLEIKETNKENVIGSNVKEVKKSETKAEKKSKKSKDVKKSAKTKEVNESNSSSINKTINSVEINEENNDISSQQEDIIITQPDTTIQNLDNNDENQVIVSTEGKSVSVTTVERTTHVTSIKQANNILALQSMVQNSKHTTVQKDVPANTTSKTHVTTLSKMINRISNSDEILYVDENSRKLQALNANLANIRSEKSKTIESSVQDKNTEVHTKNKTTIKEDKKSKKEKSSKKEKDIKEKPNDVKKKKGLFGWFKK